MFPYSSPFAITHAIVQLAQSYYMYTYINTVTYPHRALLQACRELNPY